MKIKEGNSFSKNNKSIADIEIGEYLVCVFEGKLSTFDILIKYKKKETKFRTPKHIHWVVDILLKRENKARLTKNFVKFLYREIWLKAKPLNSRSFQTIKDVICEFYNENVVSSFEELNKYGEYPCDFLTVLLILLATQEKTNNVMAHALGDILLKLNENKIDIYGIINLCNFKGK